MGESYNFFPINNWALAPSESGTESFHAGRFTHGHPPRNDFLGKVTGNVNTFVGHKSAQFPLGAGR